MDPIERAKNQAKLMDFVIYCGAHPDERFWQALRNWSPYNFIFGGMKSQADLLGEMLQACREMDQEIRMREAGDAMSEYIDSLHDTFYNE